MLIVVFFQYSIRFGEILLQFCSHFVQISVLFPEFIDFHSHGLLIDSLFQKLLLIFNNSHRCFSKCSLQAYYCAAVLASNSMISTFPNNFLNNFPHLFHIIPHLIDHNPTLILILQFSQLFLMALFFALLSNPSIILTFLLQLFVLFFVMSELRLKLLTLMLGLRMQFFVILDLFESVLEHFRQA